jgi:hypothetical protein
MSFFFLSLLNLFLNCSVVENGRYEVQQIGNDGTGRMLLLCYVLCKTMVQDECCYWSHIIVLYYVKIIVVP